MTTTFLKISSNGNKIFKISSNGNTTWYVVCMYIRFAKLNTAPSYIIIFHFSLPFSIDKERYSREFQEYQQTDDYKEFIAQQEAAKKAHNGDPGSKTVSLSSPSNKKPKKSKKP